MSPLRKRRERQREARKARREELSARLRGEEQEASAAEREERRAKRSAARKSGTGVEPGKRQPKQRARRKARAARIKAGRSGVTLTKRVRSGFDGARRARRRGLRSTGDRAKRAAPGVRRAFDRGWALVAPVFAFALGIVPGAERLLRRALAGLGRRITAFVGWLDRLLTPLRGAFLVTLASAGCLVLSQFVYYRGVEIGQPAYGQVSTIASAPQVDLQRAGEAHSYLLIPLAAFAVVMAAVAVFAKRRRAAELVALAGLAGIAVTLLVDMPSGLDAGLAGARFSGAHAVLREGFWAQLAASAGLVICGAALSLDLRPVRSGAQRPLRRRSRRRRPSASPQAPSLAESGT